MAKRDSKPRSFGNGINFIIFRQSAGMGSPGKSALDNPTEGSNKPFFRLDTFRNIASFAGFDHMIDKGTPITRVAGNTLDSWVFLYCQVKYSTTADGIVNICGMDDYSKQIAFCVCHDVALSAFRFFPPSIPRLSALYMVFALCESMMQYDGLGSRPASIRLFSTKSARRRSQSPLSTAR